MIRFFIICLYIVFLTIWPVWLKGQDYINYQKIINRTDEDVIANNLSTALLRFDTVYNNYSFIYSRHCIKALQISCAANDSARVAKWLEKAFKQGVPLWVIRVNKLAAQSLGYSSTQPVITNYDTLRAEYKASINYHLAQRIDSLLKTDQELTELVNNGFFLFRYTIYYYRWRKNNKKQFAEINSIIDTYGYPGERLIGLPVSYEDSANLAGDIAFYGPVLKDARAFTMLVHYLSKPGENISDKLRANVVSGHLPARQYASLSDFMAEYGKQHFTYYNSWHHDPDKAHTGSINNRRSAIGLNSFERQQQNDSLWREWRKNRIAGNQIILEW